MRIRTISMKLAVGMLSLLSIFGVWGASETPFRDFAVHTVWDGVESFGQAKVENAMSAQVRRNVVIGGIGCDAVFLHPMSDGESVAAYPEVRVRPDRPVRLMFVARVGLDEKAPLQDPEHPADGAGFRIRVNGQVRAETVLREHAWRTFAVDLGRVDAGSVRDLQISLVTDSGGRGNANYDWALFGAPVVLALPDEVLPPDTPVFGTSGALLCEVRTAPAAVEVLGVDAAGRLVDGAVKRAKAAVPGTISVDFDFSDRPACVGWMWRVQQGAVPVARGGSWRPDLVMKTAGGAQNVFFEGEPLRLRFVVENRGRAALLSVHAGVVSCASRSRTLGRILPGGEAIVELSAPPVGAGLHRIEWELRTSLGTVRGRTRSIRVWPKPPPLPDGAPSGVRLTWLGGARRWLLLDNALVRWLVYAGKNDAGALLYVREGGRWEPVGTVAPLMEVAGADGPMSLAFDVHGATTSGGRGFRLVAVPEKSTGRALRAEAEFMLTADSNAMDVRLRLAAGAPVRIGAFRGPAVHVGDRATGVRKGIAVFPGLEYLNGDERSSSTRDLAPPLNLRVVPHKFKVCVPMMFVETRPGGPVVGCVWDARQRWDKRRIAPAAAFASPNFVEGQDNHYMQLFVPSVPDFVPENEFIAKPPLELSPGDRLELRLYVVAGRAGADATMAFAWFDRLVGFPPPEKPPRSFEDEMALCRHAFLHTVWDEETQTSRHVVGKPGGNAPGFATLMLMDARAAASGQARRELLDRVRTIAEKTVREEGPAGLASGRCCHIMRAEFPYHYGMMPQGVLGLGREAANALSNQEEDGGWGYYPDARRRVLGEPGTRVIGIAARNAYVLAKWTAVSGDPAAEAGLRRALEHMKRYVVPRGAQGWECPILEPDVLASAYAVRAYVWAYMALGDKDLLDCARYWARTGLAFQYVWDDGEHPGMRYAGIPVFGSTFFHHSWIGLPVQWCGLVYAYALQELLRFDDHPWWRKQVEGITISAMWQQWPMDNEKLAGTYPDSFGNWFTRRNPAYINPEDIAVNVLALHGFDPGLRSQRVRLADGDVYHVTAPCDVAASVDSSGLRILLRTAPDQVVYATIAPVAGVKKIEGPGIDPKKGLEDTLPPGRTGAALDPSTGLLAVGVRADKRGRAVVRLTGLRRLLRSAARAADRWTFDHGREGWTSAHACTVRAENGRMIVTVTGLDPYAFSPVCAIDAKRFRRLRVRARMSHPGMVALFWRSSKSPSWGEDKRAAVPVERPDQWQDLIFDLSEHPLWGGRIVQIRLDPEPEDLPPGTRLEIEEIVPQP